MANDQLNYQQQVAAMRFERANRERMNRIQEIQQDYANAIAERNDAAARGDREGLHDADTSCEWLEGDYQQLVPQQGPQIDPRLQNFAQRNSQFLEKYGARAYEALAAADAYMTRPINPNTNHP